MSRKSLKNKENTVSSSIVRHKRVVFRKKPNTVEQANRAWGGLQPPLRRAPIVHQKIQCVKRKFFFKILLTNIFYMLYLKTWKSNDPSTRSMV